MSRPLYRHPGPAAARLDINVPTQDDPVHEADVVRWLSQMRADLAETLGGIMLRGARPVALYTTPTVLSSSPGRLVGWSLRDTSGTGFVVRLHNGADAAQPLIATAAAAANGVSNWWVAPGGISFTEGLYVETVTGSVEGTVFLGAAE